MDVTNLTEEDKKLLDAAIKVAVERVRHSLITTLDLMLSDGKSEEEAATLVVEIIRMDSAWRNLPTMERGQ